MMDSSEFFEKSPDEHQKSMDSNPLVISSSGGHIIAVANPMLALSPTFSDQLPNIKREVISPEL